MNETEHKCYDESVWGCATCSPKQPGDYCHKCFWNNKTGKHVWFCREVWKNE